ncbi:hypothetical protein ACX80W_09830 [Arthrobacter sp. TMN-37]
MKDLYPYDTLPDNSVRLKVDRVLIDDKPLSTEYINPDMAQIAFAELDERGWERAQVEVTVTGPEVELADGKWGHPQTVLQVNCGYSNTRQAVVLEADTGTNARWKGSIELDRDQWFGRATLRALIHAEVEGVGNRVIGSGDTWTVAFDDLPPSPVHGSIRVSWVDFANDEGRPYLKSFSGDPYYLRLDPEDPSLLLNNGFEGLEALLGDRKRRPRAEEALYHSTRGNIASDVWSAMFVTALNSVELDSETQLPEFPREGWQEVVLKSLFARIYPELAPDDALVEAVAARDSRDGSGDLLERLLPATARQVGLPALLRNGIELLEKDAEKDATKEADK